MRDKFYRAAINTVINDSDASMQHHHACVLARGGRIVSIGTNKRKKNSFVAFLSRSIHKTLHAEMVAIVRARKKIDLSGCDAYVFRLNRAGQLANSEPCVLCKRALQQYGIKRAYFSSEDGSVVCIKI